MVKQTRFGFRLGEVSGRKGRPSNEMRWVEMGVWEKRASSCFPSFISSTFSSLSLLSPQNQTQSISKLIKRCWRNVMKASHPWNRVLPQHSLSSSSGSCVSIVYYFWMMSLPRLWNYSLSNFISIRTPIQSLISSSYHHNSHYVFSFQWSTGKAKPEPRPRERHKNVTTKMRWDEGQGLLYE